MRKSFGAATIAALCAAAPQLVAAQTFVEQSAEVRMQLDLAVPAQALQKLLPAGWEPAVAAAGPAKDCNVRMIFVDRIDINAQDGAPRGTNKFVYLASPIQKTGGEVAGQMVIDGIIADPKDAPGPLGVYQAVHRNSAADYVLTAVSFLGYSTPTFFLGIVLVDWFAVDTHVFPAFGPQSSSVLSILGQPRALVLPVVTYAFLLYALWSRYMRSSVLDNLVQDYVRTARAKGATERRVVWRHVFRNSLISIVTLLGLSIPTMVGGAILIEVVFNYPGMGLAFYQAALNNDFEVLLGFTVLATTATVVGNLVADVGYGLLDPRVRY